MTDVAVEELAHDSRLQFFATYILNSLIPMGIVSSPNNNKPILTKGEIRMVEEMRAKNLCNFENDEFAAAVKWVAAGARLEVNWDALRKKLGGV